jgi:peptidoglycan/xylan/chitin deacetylase (PgdA/CDA1 family)
MNLKFNLFFLLITIPFFCQTSKNKVWNGKKCAVVLTYDDALNAHLDEVVPLIDSLKFKATFYIPAYAEGFKNRISEWRKAAQNNHELGNHLLFHPCSSTPSDRSWVTPEQDLNNYTLNQLLKEVDLCTIILESLDGKKERTFAFTCGDKLAGNHDFTNDISSKFTALRGVTEKMNTLNDVNLNDVNCIVVGKHNENQLIDYAKKALASEKLLVYLIHGVGGKNSLDIGKKQHRELLRFLKKNEKDIWIATMNDVAKYIKTKLPK